MKTVTLSALVAAAALSLSAPAFANGATDQIAASLGLQPGDYSVSELVKLKTTASDADANPATIQQAFDEAEGAGTPAEHAVSSRSQLAQSVGVTNASDYTVSQLAAMRTAIDD